MQPRTLPPKKWILPLIVLVAAVAPAPATAGGAVRHCGEIAFTPQSDDMVSDIRADGVTCTAARRFIRAVDGNAPRRFRGYRCTRKALDTALPSWRFRCTTDGKAIRWVRT
jgi:hypothetical protein